VFVNPMQFGEGEDYTSYPRAPVQDRDRLEACGAHLLFSPAVEEVYPRGPERATRVEVPALGDILCGAFRPGHFAGVATVVAKLFNIVQPDAAVFGEKDYQQLVVIRRMAADLDFPVQVIGVPTVREPDGLAMSSRNAYLTAEQRARAPRLYAALQEAAGRLRGPHPDFAAIEAETLEALRAAGFRPQYVAIRRPDLQPPVPEDRDLVILVAAYLGAARLIDNLAVRRVAPVIA
ncbi:MAG: pantoate--beta-alanine ligase, partial [Gammaproteobacteria bacterium]|nr:pantoate--beta-alanine ligase [Gammaproteobacteria bacterium]NIR97161.1 pantoate--beta-alanine ligase [Gammaproteobacteria bacterium]NIT62863.1 pantoate--beta-alanine ligase [Gammaproteobacteria bacterium]NIV19828.1 pantoate--beta-alanine ligase [Gammaproteobacteria bacterium]NIY31443.1 pantoate--beta-alanine ligase [Gammaproteobacteria bacterium]